MLPHHLIAIRTRTLRKTPTLLYLTLPIDPTDPSAHFTGLAGVVKQMQVQRCAARFILRRLGLREDQMHWREEAFRLVVKLFPAATVFQTRPRAHWPVVVELPVKNASTNWRDGAPMFAGGFYCHRLLHLAEIEHLFKTRWETEVTREHLGDDAIASWVLLVHFKSRRGDVPILLWYKAFDFRQRRPRLKTKFRAKTGVNALISRKRFAGMPHIPKVHVTFVVVVPRVTKIEFTVTGGAWPERSAAINTGNGFFNMAIEAIVIDRVFHFVLSRFVVPTNRANDFVITAPKRNTRMLS